MGALVKVAETWLRAKAAAAVLMGRYEAGQVWDPRRSRLPGWVRDARFDADAATRLEILRKARYFERNSAVVQRLADLFEQYTVGPNGLRFVPASSDPEWNASFSDWLADWSQMCDLSSLASFGTCQSLSARTWFVDGECFVVETRGKDRPDQPSFPRIQIVEGHRVETPPSLAQDETIQDGIRVDKNGRPVFYYVREGDEFGAERFSEVPADRMVHIFEPSRPGMRRGLSFLYAVMNDLHDLEDLQLLNMDAAKEAASVTHVIKTKTGEMSVKDLRLSRVTIAGTKGTSGGSSQTRESYYDDVFRGRAKVLKRDDEYEQHAPVRPTDSEKQLWSHLTSKVCVGTGIAKMLVFPESMQGTVVRADLDVQGAFFRARSSVLGTGWSHVYRYLAVWAKNNVRVLADPPRDYLKHKVRPPRSVNVDVGRNSNALVQEFEAGFRTLEHICGELGEDWVETMEQRGAEMSKAAEVEKRLGLQEGSLMKYTLEAAKAKADAEARLQIPERTAA